MATKKQKRAAGLAKREAYLAEVKADGLKALARSKEHEAAVRERAKTEAQKINQHHKEILAKEAERNLAAIANDELRRANRLAQTLYVGLGGASFDEASDDFRVGF